MTTAPNGPLTGVRVLDMTSVIMGPLATQLLGDQGADVITVERRGTATSRVMGHGPHPEFSGVSLNLLRNKRNIIVDLQQPAGRDVLLQLAATCDVLVTNLRPGPLARLRLAYADVAAVRRLRQRQRPRRRARLRRHHPGRVRARRHDAAGAR